MPVTMQVLDVGQGDGLYLEFAPPASGGGPTPPIVRMLVDLGSKKSAKVTWKSVRKYFEENTEFGTGPDVVLDYLVLTHPDMDHHNLIHRFIKVFKPQIRNVLYGGNASQYATKKGVNRTFDAIATTTGPGGVPVQVLNPAKYPCDLHSTAASSVAEFGAGVTVLARNTKASTSHNKGDQRNTVSVVLKVEYPPPPNTDSKSLLLTGDATVTVERLLLKKPTLSGHLSSNVLKVPHHGSYLTSNSVDFLTRVDPEYAFISADRASYNLPQAITVDLIQLLSPHLRDVSNHAVVVNQKSLDYAKFKKANPGIALPAPTKKEGWHLKMTKLAVYTTLQSMSQGMQYQVEIDDNGVVWITQ